MRKMPVKNTNFKTNQDKKNSGQEVTNPNSLKQNSQENRFATVLLSVAFYIALVYLALFLLLGLSNPLGMLVIIFLGYSLISFVIATILIGIGRKKGNKIFLYTSVGFYLASILLAYDPDWGVFRIIPIVLTLLVTVGTVMYKKVDK